jgi:hypothetical protein
VKTANAGYDVVVTNAGGSATLSAALEYLQAAVTTIAITDGNNGSFGSFVPVQSSATNIVDIASAPTNWLGTHAIRCTTPGSGTTNQASIQGPNVAVDATTHPNGVFCEFILQFPQATLNAMSTQIKPHLMRNAGVTLSEYEFGFGSDFGGVGNPLVIASDFDTGSTLTYRSTAFFGDLIQQRILVKYSGNSGRLWINGKYQSGAAITNASFGSTSAAAALQFRCGVVFAGNGSPTAPLVGYIGLARMLDGCPVQPTNYAPVTPQAKAFVNSASLTFGTPSVTTLGFAVALGATIRVGVRVSSGGTSGTPPVISDNLGNVYIALGQKEIASPGNRGITIYVATNKTAVGVNGLTLTLSSATDTIRGTVIVSTGDDPISGYDQGHITQACIGTGTTADAGAMTGSGNNQFSWCFVATDAAASGYTSTGWTVASADITTAMLWRIDATPTAVHCTPALGTSLGWACVGGTTQ